MKSNTPADYGADPLGDGKFKMVPSGDIVGREERDSRLKNIRNRHNVRNDCLGKSWDEIEARQGGKLNRNK